MRRSSRRIVAIASLILGASYAGAETRTDRAEPVFEVYDGKRTSDAATVVVPVLRELMRRGQATDLAAIERATDGRLPRDGASNPNVSAAQIRARFDAAHRKVVGSTSEKYDYKEAVKLYEEAFRLAYDNPATVVSAADAAQWLTKAYVSYAFALKREGKPEAAREAMREQIRSFADLPVDSDVYGPDAYELYKQTRKELDAAPHGTLLVSVNRADAVVTIDEVGRGRGASLEANVVAATYRVLVQVGAVSRRYLVKIDPARLQHAELRIDWDVDSRITATEQWAGIEGSAALSQSQIDSLATWSPTQSATTVSVAMKERTRWIVARRIGSTDLRTCVTSADDLNKERVSALVDCVVSGSYSTDVFSEIPTVAVAAEPRSSVRPLWPAWAALGGTVAAFGVGTYFASIDGRCTQLGDPPSGAPRPCLAHDETKVQAGIGLGLGLGGLAFMAYWYTKYLDDPRAPLVGVNVGHSSGVVTLTGAF